MTTRIPMLLYDCHYGGLDGQPYSFTIDFGRKGGMYRDIFKLLNSHIYSFRVACGTQTIIRVQYNSGTGTDFQVSGLAWQIEDILCEYERWDHQAEEWTVRELDRRCRIQLEYEQNMKLDKS